MRLLHYSDKPVTFDPHRTYRQDAPRTHGKPVGLWCSIEGEQDWKAWCEDEEFHLAALEHVHEVTLVEYADVLHIDSPVALELFHAKYRVVTDLHEQLRDRMLGESEDFWYRQLPVDWERVTGDFDGILFAPYLWSCRYDGPAFYYGIDAASACIWNLKAVTAFTPTKGNS